MRTIIPMSHAVSIAEGTLPGDANNDTKSPAFICDPRLHAGYGPEAQLIVRLFNARKGQWRRKTS
jgi:hypothetical protein